MGLDSVELLVNVEKHFGIFIPDLVAEKIITVGDFVDRVYDCVILNPTAKCQSQLLFYKLRIYLCNRLEILYEKFNPALKVKDIMPEQDRNKIWKSMQKDLQLKFPKLFDIDLKEEGKNNGWLWHSRKTNIVSYTIRDLTNDILALNHELFIDPTNITNKAEVETIIKGIISETNGVPINEIKRESRIGYDLGIS